MKRILTALLGLFLIGDAMADEASLRKQIEATYPKVQVTSIVKTPYGGLYEVFLGGEIIYTDEKFTFFIADGHLLDTKTKSDITAARLAELTKVDFSSLPLEKAIKVVKGNGSRKIAVFSDPDCPFCKRLEQNELSKIDNVTIYTFLYPIDQLHPDASNKSKVIWCAEDRSKAWTDWVVNGQLAKNANTCPTPIDDIAALAKKLGVASTPTLIFADGHRMLGAYPAEEIEKAMAGNNSDSQKK